MSYPLPNRSVRFCAGGWRGSGCGGPGRAGPPNPRPRRRGWLRSNRLSDTTLWCLRQRVVSVRGFCLGALCEPALSRRELRTDSRPHGAQRAPVAPDTPREHCLPRRPAPGRCWVWQRLRVWENDCFGEVSELRPWAETTRRSPGAVCPALQMKFWLSSER